MAQEPSLFPTDPQTRPVSLWPPPSCLQNLWRAGPQLQRLSEAPLPSHQGPPGAALSALPSKEPWGKHGAAENLHVFRSLKHSLLLRFTLLDAYCRDAQPGGRSQGHPGAAGLTEPAVAGALSLYHTLP